MRILKKLEETQLTEEQVRLGLCWAGFVIGGLVPALGIQSVAFHRHLKFHKQEMAKFRAAYEGGKYLISILDREDVVVTEFDALALKALVPND